MLVSCTTDSAVSSVARAQLQECLAKKCTADFVMIMMCMWRLASCKRMYMDGRTLLCCLADKVCTCCLAHRRGAALPACSSHAQRILRRHRGNAPNLARRSCHLNPNTMQQQGALLDIETWALQTIAGTHEHHGQRDGPKYALALLGHVYSQGYVMQQQRAHEHDPPTWPVRRREIAIPTLSNCHAPKMRRSADVSAKAGCGASNWWRPSRWKISCPTQICECA